LSVFVVLISPWSRAEQDVGDSFRDRQPRTFFQPEELSHGIYLQEYMSSIWSNDYIDSAVIETKVVHQLQETFLDAAWQVVWLPFIYQSHAISSPVISGQRRRLGIDRGGKEAISDYRHA